ncbi:hypothetical protein J2S74_003500 [Evansella vedderi]|uniref:DUF4367 domain-containing protein n=1 Tax=Evansella vedderi TaxID=38282 RepID=A0ABT9ZXY5_9BACI|nr:hypothetical protein [Evansella vedderi]MDQ0256101.1 hypothetical protein [Evansella vedderi]
MKRILIFLFLILLLISCQSQEKQLLNEDFPYNLIHESFSFIPLSPPEGWEVVSLRSDVQLQFQDWEEPENHQYSEVPYRYSFTFGRKAPDNEVTEKDMERFNEKQALEGKTNRQLYYHTYYDYYSTLEISKNGFVILLSAFDGTWEWEINGEKFLVLRQGNEWIINWYKNGSYYDLIVRAEAGITTEEECIALIESMFFH